MSLGMFTEGFPVDSKKREAPPHAHFSVMLIIREGELHVITRRHPAFFGIPGGKIEEPEAPGLAFEREHQGDEAWDAER